jgi:hypothetical protein
VLLVMQAIVGGQTHLCCDEDLSHSPNQLLLNCLPGFAAGHYVLLDDDIVTQADLGQPAATRITMMHDAGGPAQESVTFCKFPPVILTYCTSA